MTDMDITARNLHPTNPRTGDAAGSVPLTAVDAVAEVVGKSHDVFATWGTMSHKERRPHLKALLKTTLKNQDRIADVLVSETGKSESLAHLEVIAALTAIDLYSRKASKMLRTRKGSSWPMVGTKGWTEYHPLGVAAVITPWNYPFYLPMLSTIQAIAAGCTVVLKPSEVTPLSGELVARLASEAGLPGGVVQVVHGAGDVGAALVGSDVDVIAFTGSTAAGKKIAAVAAETLTPVILELGGKDAMIVLDDASAKRAAVGAVAISMLNAGQTCVAVERVYVMDGIYDEFLAQTEALMRKLSIDTGTSSDVGPFISSSQQGTVASHVNDALAKGAKVVVGGESHNTEHGAWYAPTLLTDVDHSMTVMREETFGPVLPVMRVSSEEEALELANDSALGLHGSVWSKSKKRAERVASQMKTGTVAINDHGINFFYPTIELGGSGESGLGGHMGDTGLKNFSVARSITEARTLPTTQLLGVKFPFRVSPRRWKLLAKALFWWR
jgi:acyl-CoA reductase-like NAD-dependent aldehyde dehydrogenase